MEIRLNYTTPLQNATVMAREKQGEAAAKVMPMGKKSIEEQFILSNTAIAVALVFIPLFKGEVL